MFQWQRLLCQLALLLPIAVSAPCSRAASIFGSIQGVVHDTTHHPLPDAVVTLQALGSATRQSIPTAADGGFRFPAVPLGDYILTATHAGFAPESQTFTVEAGSTPVLHLELSVASVQQNATVLASASLAGLNPDSATPTTLVREQDIAQTPGSDRTGSLAMITDYVPGAYITHDMLHMRGGHQVSWLIDGVEIPNTNIASNLGPQIDPKDIEYLATERGSYSADLGDRTYGIFDVVPKSGFDRNSDVELVLTAGSFAQTDDQLSFGSHTRRFADYVSLEGNRSDYGLSTPVGEVLHDASDGFGGFASLLFNQTPRNQLRFVAQLRRDFFQIPYDPDPTSLENQQYNSSGLRDTQHEVDRLAAFTWAHTFSPTTVLQVSPFFHHNSADYQPNAADQPVATASDRGSNYGGVQSSIGISAVQNMLQAGFYGFGQHDGNYFANNFNDESAANFQLSLSGTGSLEEEWVSDTYRLLPSITVIGGLRATQFQASIAGASENYLASRVGLALQVPRLHWVFRGFYGRFYQPPPLETITGPLATYAQSQNTGFAPLRGERDEEHQFGVQIPLPGPFTGWLIDADTFQTRANNFLDHSNIGESSIYLPVSIDGALIQGWELTLRSPRLPHGGAAHLAYSNQIAQQRGAITGGLVCVPVSSPECDVAPGYTPVDHDQRNTLNFGYRSQILLHAWASTNVYYGSGFTNGSPDAQYPGSYLPQHTTFDLAVGRPFGEHLSATVQATNVGNRRVLLDNSLTFGGFHQNDPRQIYGELRYRFHD